MKPDYDSTADTLLHIRRVQQLLNQFAREIIRRGEVHDDSKLGPEEKPYFDQLTARLANVTFGSPKYRAAIDTIRPAVEHHNRVNSHHPEHYGSGVRGMDLADLVEMFFDWKAASERHADGNIRRSIGVCAKRFDLDPQVVAIFENTARNMGWIE